MKKSNVNGQVLSENQMKEVKGGYRQVGNDPHNWKFCPACGHQYDDNDELEKAIYDPLTGLWGRTCLYCGGFIEEKERNDE